MPEIRIIGLPEGFNEDPDQSYLAVDSNAGGARKVKPVDVIGEYVSKGTDSWRGGEYWFSTRDDGKPGDGSVSNPFDASSQAKLLAILVSLSNADEPCTLNFYPGTYTLPITNSYTWYVRDGWKIIGAGIGRTIFVCNNLPTSGTSPYMFNGIESFDEIHSFVEMRDFSIQGPVTVNNVNGNYNAGGILLNVENALIEDVEVSGMGGDRFESFPIFILAHRDDLEDVKCHHIVRRTWIHHCFHFGKGSALTLAGQNPSLSAWGCSDKQFHLVEDCRLEGTYIAPANSQNFLVKNTHIDMKALNPEYGPDTLWSTGFNLDTGQNKNIRILDSVILNCRDNFRNSGCVHVGKYDSGGTVEVIGLEVARCYLHVIQSGYVYSGVNIRAGVDKWLIHDNFLIRNDDWNGIVNSGVYYDSTSGPVTGTGHIFGNRCLDTDVPANNWHDFAEKTHSLKFHAGSWPDTTTTNIRELVQFTEPAEGIGTGVFRKDFYTTALVHRDGGAAWEIGYFNSGGTYVVNARFRGGIGNAFSTVTRFNAGISVGNGITQVVSYIVTGTGTFNPGNMAAGDETTFTITVTGAATTNTPAVQLGWSATLDAGLVVTQAWVSAANTVSVRVRNVTAGEINPTSRTCRAVVFEIT